MKNDLVRLDTHCRLCASDRITTLFQLAPTPLEDAFVPAAKVSEEQPCYPLDLAMCQACGYVHLPHVVSPQASYEHYTYTSSVTVGLRHHYDEYAASIIKAFDVPKDSLMVDLGSNDGSMLESFQRLGMQVVGVEPATVIAMGARERGLPTLNEFFSEQVATQIKTQNGPARVITANYMYANIDDVLGFTRAVASLLAADGIFVVQTGYHPEQFKINMFDYIYHEHFSYFTVEVIQELFSKCGLELFHAEKTLPKGGSIRLIAQLKGGHRPVDASVDALMAEEREQGMREPETYYRFAQELAASKEALRQVLQELKASGKRVVGFGASHSTTTLIYHFGLAPFLDYLVDDNPQKQGLFSPGLHIPVHSAERLYSDKPDFALILGWQHQKSIITKHEKYLEAGGHWILPLPHLQML